MDTNSQVIKTGTSTIGITFDGGVVVGADHRATMGHFTANKVAKKVFKISEHIALTTAVVEVVLKSLSEPWLLN